MMRIWKHCAYMVRIFQGLGQIGARNLGVRESAYRPMRWNSPGSIRRAVAP
jgi:hypothetical protein